MIPPLRIYVASASAEAPSVQQACAALRASGHYRVTHDWSGEVLAAPGGPDVEAQRLLAPVDRFSIAQIDLHAVISADVVWLRVPSSVSYGCWVEWGAACIVARLQPRTLVVSGDTAKCLFVDLATKTYRTRTSADPDESGGDPHGDCLTDLLKYPEQFDPKHHAYAGNGDQP